MKINENRWASTNICEKQWNETKQTYIKTKRNGIKTKRIPTGVWGYPLPFWKKVATFMGGGTPTHKSRRISRNNLFFYGFRQQTRFFMEFVDKHVFFWTDFEEKRDCLDGFRRTTWFSGRIPTKNTIFLMEFHEQIVFLDGFSWEIH